MWSSFHFLDWSFAETKDWDQTAQRWSQSNVKFNQSQPRIITDVIGNSSLISPYFFVYFWITLAKKWSDFRSSKISNWLTCAKSTSELISFGFSDRSVRSLVSANAQRFTESKRKRLHLWLVFVLSPKMRLTNRRSTSLLMSSATHRWFRRISLFIFELAKNEAIFRSSKLINLSWACKINRWVN